MGKLSGRHGASLRPLSPRGIRCVQVLLAETGAWLEVTLNRPSALNSLTTSMVDAMTSRLITLVRSRSPVRGVLLRGAGSRVRCGTTSTTPQLPARSCSNLPCGHL